MRLSLHSVPLALLAAALFAPAALAQPKPGVGPAYEEEKFGEVPAITDKTDPKKVLRPAGNVTAYTLINQTGMKMKVIDYGGLIVSLTAPDKAGKFADVVLGFDTMDGYLTGSPYFGAEAFSLRPATPDTVVAGTCTRIFTSPRRAGTSKSA